jgi:hypothetical protein
VNTTRKNAFLFLFNIYIIFSHILSYINTTYGERQYTHHLLCFYQNISFTIHSSGANQVDNSAIIYSDQFDTLQLGVIVDIVRLTITGEVVSNIDKVNIHGCDTFKLDGIE